MYKSLRSFNQFYKQQDKIIFNSTLLTIFMSLLILIFWVINYSKLPPQLPLFYSLPWGETQLASLPQFLILSSLIILILLINLIISWHLHPSQILTKRIISLTTAFTSFLILITAFRIIYIFV